MPIGKDSITKRVAKQAEPAAEKQSTPKTKAPVKTEEKNIAPELVATTAAAPKKAPAKKATTTSTAKKTTTSAAKKTSSTATKPATATAKKTTTAAKKPTVKAEPEKVAPAVETAVLTNVAPETVAAVIGHKEDEKYEKVQIGQKMPDFLL